MHWYPISDKLSSKQKQVIDEVVNRDNNYFYIKGFTGTGKTIILLHILEELIKTRPWASLCFLTYTETLVELAKTVPFHPAVAERAPFMTNRAFLGADNPPYDYILVDEIQDMPIEDLIKLKTSATRLVCAGDFNQQMYLHRVTESELLSVLNPVVLELTDIWRLTRSLCKLAFSVAPKTRIVPGLRTRNDPRATIRLARAASERDELAWVWREARAMAEPGSPSATLLPTFKLINRFGAAVAEQLGLPEPPIPAKRRGRCDYSDFNKFWADHGVNLRFVDGSCPGLAESLTGPFVWVTTYHNAKGLTFKSVFVPMLTPETTIIKSNPDLESRLLFTALTRAAESLRLSYCGDRTHRLLMNLPGDCYETAEIPPA
jgi:superfamily I DNA/RNA helicase